MSVNEVSIHEHSIKSDEEDDPTAPFYETEVFHSVWDALRWKHVRARAPMCFKKIIRRRYMLANLVYLAYTIGFLVVDYNFPVNLPDDMTSDNSTENISTTTTIITPILDQSAGDPPIVNKLYFGFSIVHLVSAFLYWWAWDDRSWRDVVMIPEYLNHIEAGLYIWSTSWYPKIDTLGSYYTLEIHKIELAASIIDLFANFGWIMSWYMTYTRTLGRGFTFDDPDVIAFSTTTIAAIVYVSYSFQVYLYPEQYNDNLLYTYGDILYFLGACFYIFAAMRDQNWFWFLPLSGQYGLAAGKIHVDTKTLPKFGQPVILMTDCCRKRSKKQIEQTTEIELNDNNDIITSYF
ncbi:unnamed protein product [Adineta steineri]|uniref:Uncharacterized protein n=3 Tax=Adineta steineri TaxID=433720 RepID=A0A813MKE5_9BILA|nr:unnamed protein product [Adineta steineri]